MAKPKHPRKFWTREEDQLIIDHYPDTEMEQLKKMLPGRSTQAIYGRSGKLGVKRSAEFMDKQLQGLAKTLKESGKRHRFKKGHEPVNKGLKQSEYMSPEAIARTKATRFQEGQKPHNTKWDGAVTIRHPHKDRGAAPYMWIRLAKGEWQQYQHYLWEKANGAIPKNRILVCKDGDTLNPHPSNWELITRAENAKRNRNIKKAQKTMSLIRQGKKKPAKLTMYNAALRLAGRDTDMKNYLLEHRRDLVRVALANYNLKRKIKYENYEL